jgi:polyisoprenoid-binding protein YceI
MCNQTYPVKKENGMKLFKSLAITAALALPYIGHADEFKTVQSDKSTLAFGYKQMGVPMDGHFKKFTVQMNFDPANLDTSKAQFDLDLGSIDVGSDEGNDEVVGKQWFNTKAFPKASFATSSIRSLGSNHYEISGPLTIKGRTKIVTAPATIIIQGKNASFDGSFVILRSDFNIGEGPWASFDTVANVVQIKFHLLASASK